MVSTSKDDHPSKVTPVTNTGITTHAQATIPNKNLVNPVSQLHPPVGRKKHAGIQFTMDSIYD